MLKYLILDVDGTLTDGGIYYDDILICPSLPFNGKGIYIFAIDDGCSKYRSGDAVAEQIDRSASL